MTERTDDAEARLGLARWLTTAEATGPLEAADAAVGRHPRDPLAAAADLRRGLPELAPDRAAAVLEQADLARLAAERYGIDPSARLLLTRDGLEQATRPEIAARRARLLRAAGASRVLDITGGLGFDTAAFLAAGLSVTVVERDPATAALLAHNCPDAVVLAEDITGPGVLAALLASLDDHDVVFADPARRDPAAPRGTASARARPERDPARWSPAWGFVEAIRHPRVTAKVAPAFTTPPGWQAEWTSVDRTVVECAVHSWTLNPAVRRAVVMSGGSPTVVDADDDAPALPIAMGLRTWLHEPDPAVQRARAVASLRQFDDGLEEVDPESSWLTSDQPSPSPVYRSYLVVEELTGSARAQGRRLATLGVSRLTVKSRDVAADPRRTLRDLGVAEGPGLVLVLTRRNGRVVSVLAEPGAARPS